MKIPFNDIVTEFEIGNINSRPFNELMKSAYTEVSFPPSIESEKVLLLIIDMQNDFMENGELGVPNSHKDVLNTTRFIYNNFDKISQVLISLDTHQPDQIFHPMWWQGREGNQPTPYTIITASDVRDGTWRTSDPTNHELSLQYLIALEEQAKKNLCIWPYHCLEGTHGAAIEGQLSNMIHYHSIAHKTDILRIKKGLNKFTEMYGIIQPEVGSAEDTDSELLKEIERFDKIIVVGEAKSHCVLESLKQILIHFKDDPEKTKNIIVLEDCMSSIPGFEESTNAEFLSLQRLYGIQLTNSIDLKI